MPTLAETADSLEAAARQLYDEGQKEPAAELFKAAADVRRALVAAERLTVQQRDRMIKGVEHSTETREKMSKRFSRGRDPNMEAARGVGIPSLRALAAKLGCGASFLSQVKAGDRPMPADKAAEFKKLTGKDWQ